VGHEVVAQNDEVEFVVLSQATSRLGTFSRATFNHRDDGFDLNSPSVGLAAKADLQQPAILAVGRPLFSWED
jgi:hypothetical protein